MSKMVEFGKATAQRHRPEVAVTTIAMPLVYVTCSVSWHHECFGTEKNILQWCKWTYEKLYLQPLAIGFWSRVYLGKITTFKGQKGVRHERTIHHVDFTFLGEKKAPLVWRRVLFVLLNISNKNLWNVLNRKAIQAKGSNCEWSLMLEIYNIFIIR